MSKRRDAKMFRKGGEYALTTVLEFAKMRLEITPESLGQPALDPPSPPQPACAHPKIVFEGWWEVGAGSYRTIAINPYRNDLKCEKCHQSVHLHPYTKDQPPAPQQTEG